MATGQKGGHSPSKRMTQWIALTQANAPSCDFRLPEQATGPAKPKLRGSLTRHRSELAAAASEAQQEDYKRQMRQQRRAYSRAIIITGTGSRKVAKLGAARGWGALRKMIKEGRAAEAMKTGVARWRRLKHLRKEAIFGPLPGSGQSSSESEGEGEDDGNASTSDSVTASDSDTDSDSESGGTDDNDVDYRPAFSHALKRQDETDYRKQGTGAAVGERTVGRASRFRTGPWSESTPWADDDLRDQLRVAQSGHRQKLDEYDTEEMSSPHESLLAACERAAVLPKAVASKWWAPRDGIVQLSGYGMGDAMAAAVARSMRQGNVVVHFRGVDISNNALTDRSIAPLLRQISLPSARMHLHELVLNRNHIGHEGAATLATLISGKVIDHRMQRRRGSQSGPADLEAASLRTLRCEHCGLDEVGMASLLASVLQSSSLTELNLSGNHGAFSTAAVEQRNESGAAATALVSAGGTNGSADGTAADTPRTTAAALLGKVLMPSSRALRAVDVSWCGIDAHAALELLHVLAPDEPPAGRKMRPEQSSLEMLDLSWNALGSGGRDSAIEVGNRLGRTLAGDAPGKSAGALIALTHLNLSHNAMSKEACTALAQGLHPWGVAADGELLVPGDGADTAEGEGPGGNHTLVGLHLAGNCATVDARGFIRPFDPVQAFPNLVSRLPAMPAADKAKVMETASKAFANAAAEDEDEEDGGPRELPSLDTAIERRHVQQACESRAAQNTQASEVETEWSCWVCNRWNAFTFTWTPGLSDSHLQQDELGPEVGKSEHGLRNPKAVTVLVSFDGWHSETAFKQPDGTFVCSLMCPPRTAFEYCFELSFTEVIEVEECEEEQVATDVDVNHVAATREYVAEAGERVVHIRTYSSDSQQRHRRRVLGDDRSDIRATASLTSELFKAGARRAAGNWSRLAADTAELDAEAANIASCRDCAESDDLPDVVNYGRVSERHDNDEQLLHANSHQHAAKVARSAADLTIQLEPRKRAKKKLVKGKAAKVQEHAWSFPISVFASYDGDDKATLDDAFGCDWALLKPVAPRGAKKDAMEFEQLEIAVQKHFGAIKDIFKHYAAGGGGPEPFTLALNAWTDFLVECDIVDDGNPKCNLASLDMIFISCNQPGPKNKKLNPKRSLARFQFLLALIYISLNKFHKPPKNRDSVQGDKDAIEGAHATVSRAFDVLMEKNVLPNAIRDHGEEFRWGRLYNEPCDLMFKKYLEDLRTLYGHYSGEESALGETPHMCVSEWLRLLDCAGLIDEEFAVKTARLCYVRANQTVPDETQTYDHRQMTFVEFIEAIARVAEEKDLTADWNSLYLSPTLDDDLFAVDEEEEGKQDTQHEDDSSKGGSNRPGEALVADDAVVGDSAQPGEELKQVPDLRPGIGPLEERIEIVIEQLLKHLYAIDEEAAKRREKRKA